MAKRTTRTPTRTPGPSKTSDDSVTYTSGSVSVADRATDVGAPEVNREDEATRNESMASEPSEEEIRIRAYRRYLERGAGDGQDFDDWLEAERELKTNR